MQYHCIRHLLSAASLLNLNLVVFQTKTLDSADKFLLNKSYFLKHF